MGQFEVPFTPHARDFVRNVDDEKEQNIENKVPSEQGNEIKVPDRESEEHKRPEINRKYLNPGQRVSLPNMNDPEVLRYFLENFLKSQSYVEGNGGEKVTRSKDDAKESGFKRESYGGRDVKSHDENSQLDMIPIKREAVGKRPEVSFGKFLKSYFESRGLSDDKY